MKEYGWMDSHILRETSGWYRSVFVTLALPLCSPLSPVIYILLSVKKFANCDFLNKYQRF